MLKERAPGGLTVNVAMKCQMMRPLQVWQKQRLNCLRFRFTFMCCDDVPYVKNVATTYQPADTCQPRVNHMSTRRVGSGSDRSAAELRNHTAVWGDRNTRHLLRGAFLQERDSGQAHKPLHCDSKIQSEKTLTVMTGFDRMQPSCKDEIAG